MGQIAMTVPNSDCEAQGQTDVATQHFLNRIMPETAPKCTELVLPGSLAGTLFWRGVDLVSSYLNKLIGFNDVGCELVAIHATSIQSDGVPGSPRHWRRPVTVKDHLLIVVNLIPGSPVSIRPVGP